MLFRSYEHDFENQYIQYESQRAVFLQAPSSATDTGIVRFRDLVGFVAHVAECYPSTTAQFPQELIDLLKEHHAELEPELCEKIVGSLALLRRKEIIDSAT